MSKATRMYFFLAYVFSWCAYVPLALQGQGLLSGIPAWLHLAAGYGPLLAVGEMLALWGIAMARLRFPRRLMFLYPVSMLLLVLIAFRSLLWTATGRATWKGRPLPRQRIRVL